GVIRANSAIDIDLGMTAQIDSYGNPTVSEQGTRDAISILNSSATPWTAGISESVNGAANPMCAVPLFGNMLDVSARVEKVLLMLGSAQFSVGTVIQQSFSHGVFVDLTSAQRRTVSFDVNTGWTWGGAGWGMAVEPQEDLVPILIAGGRAPMARIA